MVTDGVMPFLETLRQRNTNHYQQYRIAKVEVKAYNDQCPEEEGAHLLPDPTFKIGGATQVPGRRGKLMTDWTGHGTF